MTDDAERTANLRPDDRSGQSGAAAPPSEAQTDPAFDDAAAAGATLDPRSDPHVYGGVRARTERTIGRDLLAAGALAVVLTALGLPFAMLWQVVTPRVEFVVLQGGWASIEPYPEAYVQADLVFAGIGLALGIVAAAVAWATLRERRGPLLLLGLVIGSVACQVVAWKIGAHEWDRFWEAVQRAPAGSHVWRPPSVLFVHLDPAAAWAALKVGDVTTALDSLRLGALAVMALAATFTYTVCAGWSRRPSLRTDAPE
ncbi:DUF2567 domain-containing protein [Glycomyces sp. NRRL B-16210]|uniref:DUF2567 domain-containing protein n=1 Tax=Glycomyces sp. NRRL B-16210 TaxID=1463821 RepID=UPI0004C2A221|nr:DUF2567 domain-containing protein [Glycomyces sp. NRRL B-16210]